MCFVAFVGNARIVRMHKFQVYEPFACKQWVKVNSLWVYILRLNEASGKFFFKKNRETEWKIVIQRLNDEAKWIKGDRMQNKCTTLGIVW